MRLRRASKPRSTTGLPWGGGLDLSHSAAVRAREAGRLVPARLTAARGRCPMVRPPSSGTADAPGSPVSPLRRDPDAARRRTAYRRGDRASCGAPARRPALAPADRDRRPPVLARHRERARQGGHHGYGRGRPPCPAAQPARSLPRGLPRRHRDPRSRVLPCQGKLSGNRFADRREAGGERPRRTLPGPAPDDPSRPYRRTGGARRGQEGRAGVPADHGADVQAARADSGRGGEPGARPPRVAGPGVVGRQVLAGLARGDRQGARTGGGGRAPALASGAATPRLRRAAGEPAHARAGTAAAARAAGPRDRRRRLPCGNGRWPPSAFR